MIEKIDKSLLKVRVESDKEISVLVYIKEYENTYTNLSKNYMITPLPFINALGIRVRYNDIFSLSNYDDIEYITSVSSVSSSVYIAKNIMNYKLLNKYKTIDNTISCAVIDTGIYPHLDFTLGQNRIVKFVDMIGGKSYPYDDNGHGTFVAGLIGAKDIFYDGKYSGIDTATNLVVVKALDKNGETDSIKILESMQWILDNKEKYNIRVVCMSFGSEPQGEYDPLSMGARVLWDNGIVVVAAAGNSGSDSSTIRAPGSEAKIITVGALDDGRSRDFLSMSVPDFSSRGPIFDRFKPDLITSGVGVVSTARFDVDRDYYTTMSGTSVSTPIVAGVALRLLKINPRYTSDEIKYMILRSTTSIGYDRNSEGLGRLDLNKLRLL